MYLTLASTCAWVSPCVMSNALCCTCAFATRRYRFVEISYLRDTETHKGKTVPAHTEKVVIFLPDIWSVIPTMLEYSALKESYKTAMLRKLGIGTNPSGEEVTSFADDDAAADGQSQALILLSLFFLLQPRILALVRPGSRRILFSCLLLSTPP